MGERDKGEKSKGGRPTKSEALVALDTRGIVYPGQNAVGIPQSEYAKFGSLYESYRDFRRTWKHPSHQVSVEEAIGRIGAFSERLSEIDFDENLRRTLSISLRVFPTLFDERENWRAFRSAIETVRVEITSWPKGSRLDASAYSSEQANLGRILHLLHKRFLKECESKLQISSLPVLFDLAKSLSDSRKRISRLRKFEKAVTEAQCREFSEFDWLSYRNCLIESRKQLVRKGLRPELGVSTIAFNRTRIKRRAAIIRAVAMGRNEPPMRLQRLVSKTREQLRGPWEAYLNKLPGKMFPKKDEV